MKNARKLVAAAMALAMTAALAPVNAFATEIKQGDASQTGALVAKLTVQPSYTVTIPGDVTLSTTADKTAEFKAENVMLENGQKIQVKLAEASHTEAGSTTFHAMTSGSSPSTATYTISKDNAPVAVGGVVAEFTNTSAENLMQTQTITFSKASGNFYAGEHSETLTFSISVTDVETIDFTQQSNVGEFEYYLRNNTTKVAGPNVDPGNGGAVLQFNNEPAGGSYILVLKYPESAKNISKIEVVTGSKQEADTVIAYKDGFGDNYPANVSPKGNTVTINAEINAEMAGVQAYYIYTTSTTAIYVKQINIYYE